METIQDSQKNNLNLRNDKIQISYLSKITHEIKTPIHGIRGLTEYLINNWNNTTPDTKKECIRSILEASNKLLALSKDLSIINHNKTSINFKFNNSDIVQITKRVVENFKNTYLLNKKITVKIQTAINNFIASVDEFWYEQLVINLLINAFNYSTNGVISVLIDSRNLKNNQFLVVSVTDQGTGMAQSKLQNVLTPSETELNSTNTGIGLSICREIINAHQGTIDATSDEEIGSTFEFSIPKRYI